MVRALTWLTALQRSLREDALLRIALVSFLVTAAIPLLSTSPTADLSNNYTDHLHHPFAVWVALTRGPSSVYTQPFAEAWQGSTWPFPVRQWPQMPAMAYPPGVLLFYLPVTLIGKFIPMTMVTFARISMLWVLAAAHVSMYFVWRLVFDISDRTAIVVSMLVWLLFLELGLEGFHDSPVFGCVAYALLLLRRDRLAPAFVVFALGMTLHFRVGAAFAPVGLLLLLKLWQKKNRTRADWWALGATAVIGVVCLACLLVSYKRATQELYNLTLAIETFRARILVAGIALALAGLLAYYRDWLAALATLCVLAMMLSERCAFFWHGTIMLAVPMTIGIVSERAAKGAELLRSLSIVWILLMRPLVWRTSIDFVFQEFVRHFA